MSKHWRPDEDIVRARFGAGRRLRSLDEFVRPDFAGRVEREQRQRLSQGATAGLALVAAACLGVAFGIYQAFAPHEPVAREAEAGWSADRP